MKQANFSSFRCLTNLGVGLLPPRFSCSQIVNLENILKPDNDTIYKFLHTLYKDINSEGLLEISATNKKGSPVLANLFDLNQIEQATDYAVAQN